MTDITVSNFRIQYVDRLILACFSTLTPIYFLYWCWTSFSWSGLLAVYLIASILTMVRSIFGHRAWAHKAFTMHPILEYVGLFLFTLGGIGSSIGFTTLHRMHHRFSDTPKDPHSPSYVNIFKILFFISYAKIDGKYGIDLIRDKKHLFFFKHYWTINFGLFIILYIINPALLSIWIAGLGLNIFKGNMVNVIGHTWKNPKPRNAMISSYLFLDGEFLHGNHHETPANWSFKKNWYEVDLSALVLQIFEYFGIATIKRS